jgi:hypothetical protein
VPVIGNAVILRHIYHGGYPALNMVSTLEVSDPYDVPALGNSRYCMNERISIQ